MERQASPSAAGILRGRQPSDVKVLVVPDQRDPMEAEVSDPACRGKSAEELFPSDSLRV